MWNFDTLTQKQKEALTCAALGMFGKQAAYIMGIHETTFGNHLVRARAKLNAKNTTQAVAIAISQGLIDPSEVLSEDQLQKIEAQDLFALTRALSDDAESLEEFSSTIDAILRLKND